ncbi:hypothetical protein BJF95_06105 [Rhizobium oryziradicis]|uniref:Uncharacterized protein n=1 Tax=Rhizobium oryziradicis TaxID=1867956 RepID=A0A1Q8ZPX9_9HYPH|nr:hypothetical protein BJF95_06105 [Rhizobium oryziradicis]
MRQNLSRAGNFPAFFPWWELIENVRNEPRRTTEAHMQAETHQTQKQAGNCQPGLPPTRTGKERNTSGLSGKKKATGQKIRQPGCRCRANWEALARLEELTEGRSSRGLLPANADFEELNCSNSPASSALDISSQVNTWISLPRQSAGKRARRTPDPHCEGR